MRTFALSLILLASLLAACSSHTHKLPEGPPPEYEPPRQWSDAGTPMPATSSSAAPRS